MIATGDCATARETLEFRVIKDKIKCKEDPPSY